MMTDSEDMWARIAEIDGLLEKQGFDPCGRPNATRSICHQEFADVVKNYQKQIERNQADMKVAYEDDLKRGTSYRIRRGEPTYEECKRAIRMHEGDLLNYLIRHKPRNMDAVYQERQHLVNEKISLLLHHRLKQADQAIKESAESDAAAAARAEKIKMLNLEDIQDRIKKSRDEAEAMLEAKQRMFILLASRGGRVDDSKNTEAQSQKPDMQSQATETQTYDDTTLKPQLGCICS